MIDEREKRSGGRHTFFLRVVLLCILILLAWSGPFGPFLARSGSWKQFFASLDGSVRQEMLLCSWKQFSASLNRTVRQEMILCSWKRFYVCLDRSVQHKMLLCNWKRFYASNWPPEAIPYGVPHIMRLLMPRPSRPKPLFWPRRPP